jgi:hypothetical protein
MSHGVATKDDGAEPVAILAPSVGAAHRLTVRVPRAAIFPTFRLVALERVELGRSLPSRTTVTLARA